MNELIEPVLWVLGLLTIMTGLLYVLTVIDPQTDRGSALGAPAAGAPAALQPAAAGHGTD